MVFASVKAARLAKAVARRGGDWNESESYQMFLLGQRAAGPAVRLFRRLPTAAGARLLGIIPSPDVLGPLLELLERPDERIVVSRVQKNERLPATGELTSFGRGVILAIESIGDARAKPALERVLELLRNDSSWDSDSKYLQRALQFTGERRAWLRGETLKHLKFAYVSEVNRRRNRVRDMTWGPIVELLWKAGAAPRRLFGALFQNRATDADVNARRQLCSHHFVYEPARGVRMDPPPRGKMVCTKCGYSFFS